MEERRDAPVLLAVLVAVWTDTGLALTVELGKGVGCTRTGFTAGVPVKPWKKCP
jgi:hypothetical protein